MKKKWSKNVIRQTWLDLDCVISTCEWKADKQRTLIKKDYCVNLLHRTKKKYFAVINISSITDNEKYWKILKPFFPDKTLNLVENGTTLSIDQVAANAFTNSNNYLNDIGKKTGKLWKKKSFKVT